MGGTWLADWVGVLAGVVLILLSVPRGPVRNGHGSSSAAVA